MYSHSDDFDYLLDDFLRFLMLDDPCSVVDNATISSEETIWTDVAGMFQAATAEVGCTKGYGIIV
jgi:hypothetical protein